MKVSFRTLMAVQEVCQDRLDLLILKLWFQDQDTFQIAKVVGLKEFAVFNRLYRLRDLVRKRVWEFEVTGLHASDRSFS